VVVNADIYEQQVYVMQLVFNGVKKAICYIVPVSHSHACGSDDKWCHSQFLLSLKLKCDECWCKCCRRSDYNRGPRGGRNVPQNFPNRRDDVADKLVNQLQGLVSALT